MRDTLASINQIPVSPQPVPVAPQPEPIKPIPGIHVQEPFPPLNDQETNPAAGPATVNVVISTQPQQPELQPQPQPDILQRLQPGQPFTRLDQATSNPNTVVLRPCGQTPHSQNLPCYLPLPSGMQQPGSLFSSYNPYLTYPFSTVDSGFNPLIYPPYPTYPTLPRPYPGVGYNYGVSPMNPQINPYGPYAGYGMQPNLSITPPIIFREGPTRAQV